MAVEYGRVVKSLRGRDKNSYLAVVGNDNGRILVCDGHERPIERPKRKNEKHLLKSSIVLDDQAMATNRKLRRALRTLTEED